MKRTGEEAKKWSTSSLKLERCCPHCARNNGSIHCGVHRRGISDTKVDFILQRRMRCPWCEMAWTIQAKGIGDGRHRTDRLILIGVVLYMFGLSYRRVEDFLRLLGCTV